MTTTLKQREAVLVTDGIIRTILGLAVQEPLPGREIPYELSDPFILVHESRFRPHDLVGQEMSHPHRGFDNLWYALEGSVGTGQSTGPDGAMERANLPQGGLLVIRTGRGVVHAEALGADETDSEAVDREFRGVLFWVNLARKDKMVDPWARVVLPEEMAVRHEGDAGVRVLVGEGSPIELGTPAFIFDVSLEHGGKVSHTVPSEFQGFAYLLEGEASFGANRARAEAGQLVLVGPGEAFAVEDAVPGTRYLLMAGKPYREVGKHG